MSIGFCRYNAFIFKKACQAYQDTFLSDTWEILQGRRKNPACYNCPGLDLTPRLKGETLKEYKERVRPND